MKNLIIMEHKNDETVIIYEIKPELADGFYSLSKLRKLAVSENVLEMTLLKEITTKNSILELIKEVGSNYEPFDFIGSYKKGDL